MGLAEDFDKAAKSCGCIIFILFFAIVWHCGGCGKKIDDFWAARRKAAEEKSNWAARRKAADQERARQAEETTQKAKAEAELAADLEKFGKQLVPQLQQAIDKYQEQIEQFTEQRALFAKEMVKLGVDPEQRPAYTRKGEIIEKMKTDVQQLLAARKETYIRWKELNLLRDTDDTKQQREELLRAAQNSAKTADETFHKYMKLSEDAGAK